MQPVYWHEGMFLEPHHFQQQDAYHEARLARLMQSGRPAPWGVVRFEPDPDQVAGGSFRIDEGAFLFRDGSWVSIPENADPVSIDLAALKPESGEGTIRIFLVLPRLRSGQPNATDSGDVSANGSVATRYVTDSAGEATANLYAAQDERRVPRLRYAPRLVGGDDVEHWRADHEVLQVITVRWRAGLAELDVSAFPPVVTIGAMSSLVRWTRNRADQLTASAVRLQDYASSLSHSDGRAGEMSARKLAIVDRLISAATMLSSWASDPVVHPASLAEQLRMLVQRLAVFSSRYSVNGSGGVLADGLPHYRHEDIGHQLALLGRAIDDLVDELGSARERRLALERIDEAGFGATLTGDFVSGGSVFLAVRTQAADETWLPSLQSNAKAGTPERARACMMRALPGVPLEMVNRPVSGLPQQSGTRYLEILRSGAEWDAVVEQRSFALIWPDAPGDVVLEIVMGEG